MRTVDLFSGCGGMSLGFQSAGYNIVAAFENWPAAIECYKQNFKHPVIETDLSIVRLSSRSVDKGTEHSAPLSALFYFLPFFPRLPFFSSDGLPLPLPSFINLFASSISSFISTINTFSFSSHSSRVRA